MEKHTPGPWTVEVAGRIKSDPEYLEIRALDQPVGMRQRIAQTRGANMEANARLIAAAPDLLAACIDAEEYLRGIKNPTDEQRSLAAKIYSAIAKAEGRNP